MEDVHPYVDALKIVVICTLWYASSTSDNIIGKIVLTDFPYPMTVTMVQLATAATLLGPIVKCMRVPRLTEMPRQYYATMIVPLAVGKFLSSVSSYVSIWKSSVSYAHTVKATLPIFTVILSRIIMGEKQTLTIYVTLLPIIGGVLVATMTELSFDYVGLFSALFATLCFSLQTIFSKKCLKDTGLHHMRLLILITRISTVCFLPVWLIFDLRRIVHNEEFMLGDGKLRIIFLLMCDGLFNMLHNIFAFTLLSMVTALSYAVANATKRIVIISSSLMLLRNPVSPVNILGMLTAIFGVLLYNKARYDQHVARRKEAILPRVKSDASLYEHVPSLKHSKTEIDLNGLSQHNGHILLREWYDTDIVTIIPVTDHTPQQAQTQLASHSNNSAHLHARTVHHV
ncbi:solute carrier family 35 member E1 homolog [Gigantopelta aegis]|uniref:solute carrier family 35 member E1 homolog n=1 Tax=Gigantopelta aegis TaxID=1735272 RepID=UPI001B88E167|nr:solute carrier family 35 member E1 homolog [Gigantopelta aegis]